LLPLYIYIASAQKALFMRLPGHYEKISKIFEKGG
jgi:hypothetical protein